MKTVPKESIRNAVIMTIVTIIATVLVLNVDVQPVGVEGTDLGFASINTGFFEKFGENQTFYMISEAGGYICVAVAFGFGVFFLIQLLQRKSLKAVDRNLLVLMMLYIVMIIVYVFFEKFHVNYRPILRDEGPESSFPSSHTLFAYVVMVSAIDQWNIYIRNQKLLTAAVTASFLVLFVIIVTRTLSGVHWITDIIGGILYADTMIAWYRAVLTKQKKAPGKAAH